MIRDFQQTVLPLREWLAGRTASERATIAQLWGVTMEARAPDDLAEALLEPAVLQRLLTSLSPQERAALEHVQAEGGRLAAPKLEREYGLVRHADDYPNPRAFLLALEQPATPAERLWLLGLLQSVLVDGQCVYAIPPDLLGALPPVPLRSRSLKLTPTDPPPAIYDGELDTLETNMLLLLTLAYDGQLEVIPTGGLNKASLLRIARAFDPKEKLQGVSREEHWPYIRLLRQLAEGADFVRPGADAQLRVTRTALDWMRQPRVERARRLLDGWVNAAWDELTSFVGLKLNHAYGRNLVATKRAILRLLRQVPPGEWIGLDDFAAAVKAADPDFARLDGRYENWGIVSYTRQPLDGFEFWDQVEGEQLRSIAGGTLRWLGLTDLGMDGAEPVSFRVNALGAALLGSAPEPSEPATEPLVVQPDFEVIVPRHAPLYPRFQIARVAERRSDPADDAQRYKLTRRSVQKALERDSALDDILRFLREYSARELPQNVVASLREWAGQHGQVSLRRAVLLEAREPALLEQIKRDKRVKLGKAEPLAEHVWVVREGDAAALTERLRKAGYGLTSEIDGAQAPLREHDLTVLFTALEFYAHACTRIGIESEASGALRQRVGRLLADKQLNRAYQASHRALERLKERLDE